MTVYIPSYMSRTRKKTARTKPNTQRAGRHPRSYTPLADALSQPLTFADTELAEGLQRHSLVGLIRTNSERRLHEDEVAYGTSVKTEKVQ